METTFTIKDWIGMKFNMQNLSIVKDVILGCLLYIFYINSDFETNLVTFKYILIVFGLRYILSIMTLTVDNVTNKRYFQINGHLSIFVIICFIMLKNMMFNINEFVIWMSIIGYSFLIVALHEHYTYDIIATILLNDYLIKNF